METFAVNLTDARWLIQTAQVLRNQRSNRMRQELRTKIGEALSVPVRDRGRLDCIESDELFIVIKPVATIDRDHVQNLHPLLRQSVVAACAALETYVADEVSLRVAASLAEGVDLPSRLAELNISIADWKYIEDHYKVRRRALREHILEPRIRELASTAPNQIGILMSMLGIKDWSRKVDGKRNVTRGTTVAELDSLTDRRNRIAHEGDRRGYRRSAITENEAGQFADTVENVAIALQSVMNSI